MDQPVSVPDSFLKRSEIFYSTSTSVVKLDFLESVSCHYSERDKKEIQKKERNFSSDFLVKYNRRMKQSIGTLLILGAVLSTTDSFVPSPNALNRNPSAQIQHQSGSSIARWASTMDKNDVEDKLDVDEKNEGSASFGERITNSGVASAAAMATAAVNAAVSMKTLEAPDVTKSYIALDKTQQELDEEGLPLVYDKDVIEAYWSKEKGALNKRWGYFVGKAVPFLTKLTTLFIRDGKIVEEEIPTLSKQARMDLQDLGPTFIKAGQMMSVRPDVLPTATLDELTKLQDSVEPFDTKVAVEQIEKELGGPLGKFFTSISEEPVAAASLAQVYLATLNDGNDTKVAVKVQRPSVLGTVSKDLYVLRRAAEVFQGLVDRFAPQQRYEKMWLLCESSIIAKKCVCATDLFPSNFLELF